MFRWRLAPDRPDLTQAMSDGNNKEISRLTLEHFKPTKFSLEDVASATLVVSFDNPLVASTVAGRKPTVAWNGLPAVSTKYGIARDSIRSRVTRLVDSLVKARQN